MGLRGYTFFYLLILFSSNISGCSSNGLFIRHTPTLNSNNNLEKPAIRILNLQTTPSPSSIAQPSTTSTPVIFIPSNIPEIESETSNPYETEKPPEIKKIECTNQSQLIQHLSFMDNAIIPPGIKFKKVWRIKNTGTCKWVQGYSIAFYSGDSLGGETTIPLSEEVNPGETIDLGILLRAPIEPNTFSSHWLLQDSYGNLFGDGPEGNTPFSVVIQVSEPTNTPGPT